MIWSNTRQNLSWKLLINHVVAKLKETNTVLSKLRHVFRKKNSRISLLCNILIKFFMQHLSHAYLVCVEGSHLVRRLYCFKKDPLRYCSCKAELLTQVPYFKAGKFLNLLIRLLLKTVVL